MKQRLVIILFFFAMVLILVALNAASYAPAEKTADVESAPNRSTFNAGSTGLQAFYTLLAETGHEVMRWQEPPAALLTAGDRAPSVLVLAGTLRREVTPAESADLLSWIARGGTLVLIDRDPPAELLVTSASWRLTPANPIDPAIFGTDPADPAKMTSGIAAVRPVQPTWITYNVNAVQPSGFAGSVEFSRLGMDEVTEEDPDGLSTGSLDSVLTPSQIAPFVHFASSGKNFLVEAPYGEGRIVILADPYIVANGGIALADNAILAINLVAADGQIVAFDEYHQGYGTDNNRFLQFFAGTPVVAVFFQAMLLIGLVFFSQSRRFARPVPEPEPDRLSKLEYVAAMAELQRRTRAYDLAIENIYSDFRRRVSKSLGRDNMTVTVAELAVEMSERTGIDRYEIEETLFKCEEIIRGDITNRTEAVRLAARLREWELKMGLTRERRMRG